MNYEDIIERYSDYDNWEEGENKAVSAEEENFMINCLKEKFRKGEIINSVEFSLIFNDEIFPYEWGEIEEERRHGWVVRDFIISIEDNEHYMVHSWHHDDCGMEFESQIPCRCYYKEVKVMKWVCEPEEDNCE